MHFLVSCVTLLLSVSSSQQVNETETIQTVSLTDNISKENATLPLTNTVQDYEPYNSTFEQVYIVLNDTNSTQENESQPIETIVYAPVIIHIVGTDNALRKKNPLHHLLHGVVPNSVLRPITHLFGHHHHHGPLAFLNPLYYLTRTNANGTEELPEEVTTDLPKSSSIQPN